MDIHFAIEKSSLGLVLVAASSKGICAIMLGDNSKSLARELQDRFPKTKLLEGGKHVQSLVTKVIRIVEHPKKDWDLPLDIQGTAFQQRVWQVMRKIPLGKTSSYKEIAQKIGKPKAARAVAQACGANNIAVAIPCHRVIHTDGSLSGYRWGVERKRTLLQREAT